MLVHSISEAQFVRGLQALPGVTVNGLQLIKRRMLEGVEGPKGRKTFPTQVASRGHRRGTTPWP